MKKKIRIGLTRTCKCQLRKSIKATKAKDGQRRKPASDITKKNIHNYTTVLKDYTTGTHPLLEAFIIHDELYFYM